MSIQIREHIESDLNAYFEWQSDPEIASFISWLPRTQSQIEQSLHEAIMQQQAEPRTQYYFAVVESVSSEVVGDVGFTIIKDGVGDCGWFIRRRFWGNGYATEATRQLIAFAFAEIGLRRLRASCKSANLASRRVMEKSGFRCIAQTDTRLYFSLEH